MIAMPPSVVAFVLLGFFCAVAIAARRVVLWRCGPDARAELAKQADNVLTGVSATFAFFVGFAITICWGAVTAGQNAVEQQSAAIQTMAWELRNIGDAATSTALLDKLSGYAQTASDADAKFLAGGDTAVLPSAAALNDVEDAVNAYASGSGSARAATLLPAASAIVSSSASVAAVANRGLPRPLAMLLLIVAILVTAIMGITTVTSGRSSMVFVYIWCLIPALSLTVVWALAYPFALRSGMTLAPLRAVAQSLATR
jgi:fructose-specific phosphotransferase system IIC component